MEIGFYFDFKGFGIGVFLGVIYREDFLMVILKLSDIGMFSFNIVIERFFL